MKNGRVKDTFVAAEVARDVRFDVHVGTPALKALRMIVSLAAMRVGRGHFTEVKFLKRTLRWHEQWMSFSWSGSTRYVTELAVTDTGAVMKTRTPGSKATGGGTRDALEAAEYLSGSNVLFGGGVDRNIVLDRPDCQRAAKAVRSASRMRMLDLAKFLVSHSEFEWLYQAQDVPEKYGVYGDSD